MKKTTTIFGLLLGLTGFAEVKLEKLKYERAKIIFDGKAVSNVFQPKLKSQAAGEMLFYDPTTRQTNRVFVSADEAGLQVFNKQRQRVHLGKSKLSLIKKNNALIFLTRYAKADAYWKITLTPMEDNGLDVQLEIAVNENYWLKGFDFDLFKLITGKGSGDSGALRSRLKRKKGKYLSSLNKFRINYPCGPDAYVPAAVFQGDKLTMGVCRLDIHNVWRPDYNELKAEPDRKRRKLMFSITSGWAHVGSFGNFYKNKFKTRYRFRFAKPKKLGEAGYLRLVDAKELWIDYVKELNEYVPSMKSPKYDKSKNNLIITHYFTSESIYMNQKNPMGYLMNHPGWKDDRWEWGHEKINSKMSNAEIKRRTGFSDENFGNPVKWVKPMAERLVREVKDTKAQSVIVVKSATHPLNGELNYIPESQEFHPLLEERVKVKGPVRNWDWAKGEVEIFSPDGKLIAVQKDVMVHAADKEKLIQPNRNTRSRHVFLLEKASITPHFKQYMGKFNMSPKQRITLKKVGAFEVVTPKNNLVGKKVGDIAELTVTPKSWNPTMHGKKFKMKIKITAVERAAVDIWAKTLTDAGVEIGFLVREDFTTGPPWSQWTQAFDFGNDWQYKTIKRRFQWHRARFGKKCRWFYLDVFGDWTPQFVFMMLRKDFPDCFFFVEHPNDVAERTVNGWKWSDGLTDLEKYVSPNALVTVLPDRMMTWNKEKDRKILSKYWHNPNYFLLTHRTARKIVKLMQNEK